MSPSPRLPQRPQRPQRLLVVELLGGFGDLLIALPAIHALAAAQPQAQLRVATVPAAAELLVADPAVDSVVGGDLSRPHDWLDGELQRHPPDLVVSTTMHSGLDQLIEQRVPGSITNLWRNPPPNELIDRRFLRLLADDGLIQDAHRSTPLQVALTSAERDEGRRLLASLLGPGARRPLLVLPGSGMAVKRWPAERWQQLVEQHAGRALVPVAEHRVVPAATPLPAGLDLRGLAALAGAVGEAGGRAVGGDTGPVRLAAATRCPAVGLYGPTLAARYGLSAPWTQNLQGLPGCEVRRPTAITEQECWWSARCPLDTGPLGTGPLGTKPDGSRAQCMADVSVADVLAALERVGEAT